jgi:hypothetical protein
MSPTEENTIVVETQNKKEFFSFDHIASEESQQDQIYDSIGQPVLEESFKVPPSKLRASIAASSRMDRPVPARPTRSWATPLTSSKTTTPSPEASCHGCCKNFSLWSAGDSTAAAMCAAPTSKYTTSRSLIWYVLVNAAKQGY